LRVSHLPLRLTTGAFILNAGLSKRDLTDEAAQGLQGMASASIPQVGTLSPPAFTRLVSTGEIALGAALLAPFVSPVLAGAGLAAFGGALLRMWWRTPGMHEEGSIRPTQQGTAVAKDVWLLGAGTALVLDGLADGAPRAARKARKGAHERVESVREALPV
jgi:MFS family permease